MNEITPPPKEVQAAAAETLAEGGVVAVTEEGAKDEGIVAADAMIEGDPGNENAPEVDDLNLDVAPAMSYEDFSLGATTLLGASEALFNTIDDDQPISDAVINQLSTNIAELNDLLQQNITEQDVQELYPQLLELKPKLVELKVRRIKEDYSSLIEDFSSFEGTPEDKVDQFSVKLAELVTQDPQKQELVAQKFKLMLEKTGVPADSSIDTFTDAYQSIEDADEEISNIEEVLKEDNGNERNRFAKFKKYAKVFGATAVLTGTTLKEMTFDKNDMDLGAFLSFVINPTGKLAEANLDKHVGENGEVPYHMFKEKFRNYKDVGGALASCSENLSKIPEFQSWQDRNSKDLDSLKNTADSKKTLAILADLQENVLKDSADRWSEFSGHFASALYGREGLTLNSESVDFMKEILSNNAGKLKEYWHIGDSEESSDDQSDDVQPEQESSDATASDESQADTSQ